MKIRTSHAAAVCAKAAFLLLLEIPFAPAVAAGQGPPAVEATELAAAGGLPPTYVDGPSPSAPKSKLALQPTIVCRLLIDAKGRVTRASVYRPRPELADFEKAALASVKAATFLPARRGHETLAAWVNWPVTFDNSAAEKTDGRDPHRIRVKGSDTIGGTLGPAIGKEFKRQHPDVEITAETKGSATAFSGLIDGSADLGMASRPVNDSELAQAKAAGIVFHEFVLGYDGVAVIVHPINPITALVVDDVAKLFSGEASHWHDVGGGPGEVHLIGRPTTSGTRAFFRDKILRRDDPKRKDDYATTVREIEHNEDIVEAVAHDPLAIAYVSLGFLRPGVRALALSRSAGQPSYLPEARTVADGRYPIFRALLCYVAGQPSGALAQLIHFGMSPQGQRIVAEYGFVPSDTPLDADGRK